MGLLKEKDSLVKPAFEDLVLLAPLSVLLSVMLMHQASKIQKIGVCETPRKSVAWCSDVQFLCNCFIASLRLSKDPCTEKGVRTIDLKKITVSIKSRVVRVQDQAPRSLVSISLMNNWKLIVLVRMQVKEPIVAWLWERELVHDF